MLPQGSSGLSVDFCGEIFPIGPGQSFTIGRDADLVVDDNPFLHRIFLVAEQQGDLWVLSNVGAQLSATVADEGGRMEAFLAPGASVPLVFPVTTVSFTAGPTTYELVITNDQAEFRAPVIEHAELGDTTVGPTHFTPDQLRLVLVLAEPRLRGEGRASVVLPTSSTAARRLGWTRTKFNRKLDNVCEKLTKIGVRGLHGDTSDHAANRRSRLVEYAIATRLVTAEHLPLLDSDDGDDGGTD